SNGVFSDLPAVPRFGPYRFSTSVYVTETGLAYGYQLGDCVESWRCVRLGVSLASDHLRLRGREDVLRDPPGNGPADFTASAFAHALTTGDDDSLAANLGLIWEVTHTLKLALTYRQGPRFDIKEDEFAAPNDAKLHLPDQYVIGVAYQPTSSLTVSSELDRITYSNLVRNNRFSAFDLKDGTEVRVGAEYVLFVGDPIQPTRLALMAGYWLDPDHQISFTGHSADPTVDLFDRAFFPPVGTRRNHVTAGIGANFGRFQVDAGCDRATAITVCSLSSVVRF
ncbi:MAG TPA: hypothetical protein VGE98_03075, partial [Thermoanaerobaculia bacterium]